MRSTSRGPGSASAVLSFWGHTTATPWTFSATRRSAAVGAYDAQHAVHGDVGLIEKCPLDKAQLRATSATPRVHVWHEHWALRADGAPSPSFGGYADGCGGSAQFTARYGTPLIETTGTRS